MRTVKGERADVRPSRAPQWYANACAARASIARDGVLIQNDHWQQWTLEVLRRDIPDVTEAELAEVFAITATGPRMWLVNLVRDMMSRRLAENLHRGMSREEHRWRGEYATRSTFPDITDEEIRLALDE